ncbi:MAG: hypothetical protein WEB88_07680 [Gemmatimonadota bacterium]
MFSHPAVRTPRTGTTLLELTVVLALLAVLVGIAAPFGRRAMDEVAVRAARDALGAMAARARLGAAARGGATLAVSIPEGLVTLVDARGRAIAPDRDLAAEFGVLVATDGRATTRVQLRWDVLGIGRAAARTLRFRRGAAEARLTVSLYGRVRSW